MKVTPRGRDYLQGTIILGILALILNASVLLALALTLSVVALIAYILNESVSKYSVILRSDDPHLSVFKGEAAGTNIAAALKRARWVIPSIVSVEPPPGVELEFSLIEQSSANVRMRSKYAGRFEGFLVLLEVRDVLNIFSKEIPAMYADFWLDCLPNSILEPIPTSRPIPLTLGERSLRSPGSSLELYTLDTYHPTASEAKNVLWKRVARMPDERLIVRIRESSVPKMIRIGFIQIDDRFSDLDVIVSRIEEMEARKSATLQWKDLACEGLGAIGNDILALGCSIEILYTYFEKNPLASAKKDYVAAEKVEGLPDLADSLMNLWRKPANGENNVNLFRVLEESNLIVCGMRDLRDNGVAFAVGRKPALIIAEEKIEAQYVGKEALIFTGSEDVKKLVTRVVER